MFVVILDGSMKIEVGYDRVEPQYKDNVFMALTEDCPKDERVFGDAEIQIALTPEEAEQLALALNNAATESRFASAVRTRKKGK